MKSFGWFYPHRGNWYGPFANFLSAWCAASDRKLTDHLFWGYDLQCAYGHVEVNDGRLISSDLIYVVITGGIHVIIDGVYNTTTKKKNISR